MTATEATTLATILDKHFEEFADIYADAIANDGGLEDVIALLRGKVADQ